MRPTLNFTRIVSLIFAFVAITLSISFAQSGLLLDEQLGGDFGDEPSAQSDNPVTFSAWFKLDEGSRKGTLRLKADIAENWHLYSTTTPKGGPLRSKMSLPESADYKLTGDFEPGTDPHVIPNQPEFGVPVEYFKKTVTWSAPIELSEGVDPSRIDLKIKYRGQTCVQDESGNTGACIPLSEKVQVSFDGFEAQVVADVKFSPKVGHVLFQGKVSKPLGDGPIQAGDLVRLDITAESQGDYHIYAYADKKGGDLEQPTLIVLTKTNGWKISGPTSEMKPIKKTVDGQAQSYHEDPVTWSYSIKIPDDAAAKTYTIGGLLGYQTCTKATCDRPVSINFAAEIPIGSDKESVAIRFGDEGSYSKVEKALEAAAEHKSASETIEQEKKDSEQARKLEFQRLEDTPEEIAEMALLYDIDEKINYLTLGELENNPVGQSGALTRAPKTTFWTAMFGAFVGGMLLNLMPCVFPVLGIKVMGFVQQAGEKTSKIRMHGLAFAAGLVVSMWVLAGLILALKFFTGQSVQWGQQMGNPYFVGGIIVLLFLLGLNLAGVFEIGTSMTRVGGSVQGKKGYSGSFLSGVLTTLIATPCSGPFLGAAMGYTLAQTEAVAMVLFTVFAIGIASPYLLLAFFPALIKKLPRPGAWMETFKVTMAFALFATVAFFMQTFGSQTGSSGLAWLAMALVVLALAAYFYGHWSPPHIKPFTRRWFGLVLPAVIACVGLWMCYDAAGQKSLVASIQHSDNGLAWQAWNPGKVEYTLAKKKKVVWVDYTADW